jgi:methionyl-tRNA formyltransferase
MDVSSSPAARSGSLRVGVLAFQGWGLSTLRAVVASGHSVPWVVTHPEGEQRYYYSFTDSVREYAEIQRISVVESHTTEDPEVQALAKSAPADVLVTSNWRTHVDAGFLAAFPLGGINVHRSLLPRYGGLAPLNWAIARGERETGVTIHVLAEHYDLGDILGYRRLPIGEDDTATDLFHATGDAISTLVPEVLAALAAGTAVRTPQDPSQATFFHGRTEKETRIDWTQPPVAVCNLVRAQSDPFPNAFTYHNGTVVKVKRCSLPGADCYRGTPGRVAAFHDDGVVVICGLGPGGQAVIVQDVARDGGAAIPACDYFISHGAYLE